MASKNSTRKQARKNKEPENIEEERRVIEGVFQKKGRVTYL